MARRGATVRRRRVQRSRVRLLGSMPAAAMILALVRMRTSRWASAISAGNRPRCVQEVVTRHDSVHEPDRKRLAGFDAAARQHEVARHARARRARGTAGRPHRRTCAPHARTTPPQKRRGGRTSPQDRSLPPTPPRSPRRRGGGGSTARCGGSDHSRPTGGVDDRDRDRRTPSGRTPRSKTDPSPVRITARTRSSAASVSSASATSSRTVMESAFLFGAVQRQRHHAVGGIAHLR